MPLDAAAPPTLAAVSTATITTILLKKGLRNSGCAARPLAPNQPRLVGPALTCASCPPGRLWRHRILGVADLNARRDRSDAGGLHRGRHAIGVTDAGIFGDILCARMKKRASPG